MIYAINDTTINLLYSDETFSLLLYENAKIQIINDINKTL